MTVSFLLLFIEWFSHTETFYNGLQLVPNVLGDQARRVWWARGEEGNTYPEREFSLLVHLNPQSHPKLWRCTLRGGASSVSVMEARRQGVIQSGGEVLNISFRNVNNYWGFNTIFLVSLEILYIRACLIYWTSAQWVRCRRGEEDDEEWGCDFTYPFSYLLIMRRWSES